jgi:phosphoglycerol transferase MdoB-like AlkP superfamily enzyme
MSEKYKNIAVVCKKEYPKKGLEVGDYFPTSNYTDQAIDEAINRGDLEIKVIG